MSELDEMAARFSEHREIADTSTVIGWTFDEDSTFLRSFSDGGDLFPVLALEPKVVERRSYLTAANYNDEFGIVSRRRRWTEPNRSAALETTVANHRKAARLGEETNGGVQVTDGDCEVSPAHWHDLP
jgi:hypothetical protein